MRFVFILDYIPDGSSRAPTPTNLVISESGSSWAPTPTNLVISVGTGVPDSPQNPAVPIGVRGVLSLNIHFPSVEN